MASNTKIEWTDTTWHPVRGCTKISPGCKHCYAETFAERFRGVKGHPYEFGFDLRLVPEKLFEPFSWASPKMVFVNSMSDLFHTAVPDDFIARVARVMVKASWHTYQVLTKRHLRDTPAEVKFLSIEPLLEDLGFIDLQDIDWGIVGGESGPGARPMQESWARSVLHQCRASNIPFFFKQWGGVQKKKAGRDLQGRTYDP